MSAAAAVKQESAAAVDNKNSVTAWKPPSTLGAEGISLVFTAPDEADGDNKVIIAPVVRVRKLRPAPSVNVRKRFQD